MHLSYCHHSFETEGPLSMIFDFPSIKSSPTPFLFNVNTDDFFIKTVDLHRLQFAQYGFAPLYLQMFLHLLHCNTFNNLLLQTNILTLINKDLCYHTYLLSRGRSFLYNLIKLYTTYKPIYSYS